GDRPRAPPAARRGGAPGPRAARGGGLPLRELWHADGRGAGDRGHGGAPERPLDVRHRGRARPPADVRRLPGDRPDEQRKRRQGLGPERMNAPMTLPPEPAHSEEDRARADHYALLARLFQAAPDTALLAALVAAGGTLGAPGGS